MLTKHKLFKPFVSAFAALTLIGAPVLADTQNTRIADRLGPVAEKREDNIAPVILAVGAGLLLVVILASRSSEDKPESD